MTHIINKNFYIVVISSPQAVGIQLQLGVLKTFKTFSCKRKNGISSFIK